MTAFRTFRSNVNPFLPREMHRNTKLLCDTNGYPVGLQNPSGWADGLWVPIDLTAAEIAAPSALIIADLNSVFRLNVPPYTRYMSNGTSLTTLAGGAQGPAGMPGPAGPAGPMPEGGPFLPLMGGTMQGGINIGAGATLDVGPQLFNAACRLFVQNDTYHDNVITIQNNSINYLYNGTGTTTSGSPSVTVSSTAGVNVGRLITGPGIVFGTTVAGIPDGTHFTMSANAGAGAGTGTVQVLGSRGNAAFRFLASDNSPSPKAGYEVAAVGYSHVATMGGGFVANTLYAEIGNLGPASDPNDTDFAVVNTHATGSLNFPATSYIPFKIEGSTGNVTINDHLGRLGFAWTETTHRADFFSTDATTAFSIVTPAAGLPVSVGATGSTPNIPVWLSSQGNAGVFLISQGQTAFEAYNPASAVNYLVAQGSAAGGAVTISPFGSDANIDMSLGGKGTGGVYMLGRVGFQGTSPVAKPTGWGPPTGTATRATFATSSVTLPVLAEHVKALIDDLTAYGLIGV